MADAFAASMHLLDLLERVLTRDELPPDRRELAEAERLIRLLE